MSLNTTPSSAAMSTLDAASPQSPLDPGIIPKQTPRGGSCILCKQRKVKCDRKDPCSNCNRARVECIFRAPAPPKRRKKKEPEVNLVARLKRYEELLKDYGAKVNVPDSGGVHNSPGSDFLKIINSVRNTTDAPAVAQDYDRIAKQQQYLGANDGKMIAGNGRSRYLESVLWNTLSDEFRNPKEMLQESTDEEQDETTAQASTAFQPDGGNLVLGLCPIALTLRALHPSPVHIFKLWQKFLENINPLSKIIHAPSLQQKLIDAAGDLENVSKATSALMFAIYFSAVSSLTEMECTDLFGETKPSLLTKYHLGTQKALIEARFLQCSDLAVLQAFVLYLLAVRPYHDHRSQWTLVGLSIRIGQRMGLHRDGESLGISFFETEIRRRVWWQIAQLDAVSGELSGSNFSRYAQFEKPKVPLNVNDSDLNPNMRELPVEHAGPTEMMFCGVRYQVGVFLSSAPSKTQLGKPADVGLSNEAASLAKKDRLIGELEKTLEDKFLKYCDPVLPLHFLSIIMARSAILVLWLRAHHPRQSIDNGASMTQEEREMMFTKSLKYLEYEAVGHTSKIAQQFRWHTVAHFQWHAIIYALSELRRRTMGEGVEKAWQLVGEVYKHHPEMLSEGKSSLYGAVGNLAIKAWEARETEYMRLHGRLPPGGAPEFISTLRLRKRAGSVVQPFRGPGTRSMEAVDHVNRDPQVANPSQNIGIVSDDHGGYEPAPASESWMNDLSPMDWTVWDDLLQDFELQPLDSNGLQTFGQL
ncbi:hypothetical protein MMC30_006423 [Trapelia coarctata]|nr:hypothetical protein [Trapelia coarctata]